MMAQDCVKSTALYPQGFARQSFAIMYNRARSSSEFKSLYPDQLFNN